MSAESEQLHFAITMDGNRRWATDNGNLPVEEGHLAGAKRIEPIVRQAAHDGVDVMTFFAFATNNLKRSPEELAKLNEVFLFMLHSPAVDEMHENNVRVNVIGEIEVFPGPIVDRVQEIHEMTLQNSGIICNFALNYDGQNEIVRAANVALSKKPPEMRLEPLTKQEISDNTYTAGMPDPAMIIRTGGMQRTSGFLLWQSANTEQFYTDTLWPDFTVEEYKHAVEWFHEQPRNFGK